MLEKSEIEKILASSGLSEEGGLDSYQALAGDASSKEFYRLLLNHPKLSNVILIKFAGGSGPLSTGADYNQDQSFIEIGNYLRSNLIPVPELYWSDLKSGFGIEEDLGDCLLADYLRPEISSENKFKYFAATIDLISEIQSLPQDDNCIIFQRHIAFDNYFEESMRFISFYLQDKEVSDSEKQVIEDTIRKICEQVSQQKQVPIYRDLTAWNVMVTDERIRLVDFQDMILGAYAYDLVSLLHDRDSDLELGDTTLTELITYYMQANNLSPNFLDDYYHCLLQRHLRLAGQFLNLTKNTGKDCYKDWVPGCMYRLGRTFVNFPNYSDFTEIVSKLSSGFLSGIEKPYAFTS